MPLILNMHDNPEKNKSQIQVNNNIWIPFITNIIEIINLELINTPKPYHMRFNYYN